MADKKVLVVGTTADYIDTIERRYPGRACFITDPDERKAWPGEHPKESSEILSSLEDFNSVLKATQRHLEQFVIKPSGIACFDCESLLLAAFLAESFSLPFSSPKSVANSRSKYESHRLWQKAGISCPESILVKSREGAIENLEWLGGTAVLKPLAGSGSELVFLCRSKDECTSAFDEMTNRLEAHKNNRMYAAFEEADPKSEFLMESYIRGTEYSCDFTLETGRIKILRLARKIPAVGDSFGTTLAYVLPAAMPVDDLEVTLFDAAKALGFSRAFCMADFMIQDDEIYLLEMTPRPGGDCLPELMLTSSGFDSLGAALEFAEGKTVNPPQEDDWQRLVGVRFIAKQAGTIIGFDDSELRQDPFVLEVNLKHKHGHRVVLPPEDYDSRIIGHAIFDPSGEDSIEVEAPEIAAKLRLDYES